MARPLAGEGALIWHQGVSPDIAVRLPPDETPLRPAAEQGMTAAQLRVSGDAPLLRALAVLTRTVDGEPSGPMARDTHGSFAAQEGS